LKNENRFNVAITRARNGINFVGKLDAFKNKDIPEMWKAFIGMICSNNFIVNSIEPHETHHSNDLNYHSKNELIPQIVKKLPSDLESYFPFLPNLEGN